MAGGYTVAIASETKAFRQGIEGGIIEPLEGAEETLQGLARDRSLSELEDNLEDAQKASQKLDKETKDTARSIEQEFRDTYRKFERDADDGYSSASESARAFKDEAKANFAETASSFDGSMSSIADMAQGTLGGLATSIAGPLGIGLAAAGAAAGVLFSGIVENAEDMKEGVSEAFTLMVENGTAALTELQIQQRIFDILNENIDQLKEISELTGIPLEMLADKLARGGEGAQTMADHIWQMRDAAAASSPEFYTLERAAFKFAAEAEKTAKASELFEIYGETVNRVANQQGARLEGLAAKYDKLPRDITTTVNLDTAALDRELAKPRRIKVNVEGLARDGRRVF